MGKPTESLLKKILTSKQGDSTTSTIAQERLIIALGDQEGLVPSARPTHLDSPQKLFPKQNKPNTV